MALVGSDIGKTTSEQEMVQLTAADCIPSPSLSPKKKGLLPAAANPGDTSNTLSLIEPGHDQQMAKGPPHVFSGDEASLAGGVPPPSTGTSIGADAAPSTGDAPPTQTVKVPQRRGKKSKAELRQIRMAEALEDQSRKEAEPEIQKTSGGRPRRQAAMVALQYLHEIAEELTRGRTSPTVVDKPIPIRKAEQVEKKGGKRKRRGSDEGDKDFVVSEDLLKEEEREEEDEEDVMSEAASEEELCGYNMSVFAFGEKPYPHNRGLADNGFHNSIMAPVFNSAQVTMDFRNLHHSAWEFPDWLPCKTSWHFLSERDAETYLPLQLSSAPFTVHREGIQHDQETSVLNRFQSLPPHPERQDFTFFVGGPVWCMEWCPTPAGSGACQYLALYCHRGMDDRHQLHVTHRSPTLLQIWSLGNLSIEDSCDSGAAFCYGLAMDEGCIWDMKFCPSGGWELPATPRKSTHMARLGLLAAAFSSGHVEIYSLPHPEPLQSHRKSQVTGNGELIVCKVDSIVRLYVGSIKACNPGQNGQCFSLSWVHTKPHQYLAAGFYDGTVAIWDLKTKSVLQRVRQGHVIKQYPFLSFPAHNQAVRGIEWCKADRNFLATCSGERCLKFWDLRRLAVPINDFRRFQNTEITWLLPYCGVVVAQDNCNASHGQCGVHYVDSGFMGYKTYFAAPRRGTVWSVSGSDWLGSVTAGDITGEVVAVVMPSLNVASINAKRPSDRRFSVYKVEFLPGITQSEENHSNSQDMPSSQLADNGYQHFKPKSYRAASSRFQLLFQDADLRCFKRLAQKESIRRMRADEIKVDGNFERIQVESIHKVRFSSNLDSHPWLVSGGQSGLVRVHCIHGLVSPVGKKLVQEQSCQFQAMCDATPIVPAGRR